MTPTDSEAPRKVDESCTVDTLSLAMAGETVKVDTKYGPITVTVCGDAKKPALLTCHDIGLNHRSCFQGLFMCAGPESRLLKNFCVYHIDLPGHEENATEVPAELLPVTVDKLSDMVDKVMKHFEISECMGLGVGYGAYVLTKYATTFPGMVGLIAVTPLYNKPGWHEWGNLKAATYQLWYGGLSNWVREYIISRLVHNGMMNQASDLTQAYRKDLSARPPRVLMHYLQAAMTRSGLQAASLKSQVLMFVGDKSPFKEESLDMNTSIASHGALVLIDGAGTVTTEERPQEMINPIDLFLQRLEQQGFGV
uniref:AB hydrolase-1 domain-containing protein n=1 Tax=Pyramimonas obovata TaxID=1411642 RepID=A0A7S0RDD7_9CHLO